MAALFTLRVTLPDGVERAASTLAPRDDEIPGEKKTDDDDETTMAFTAGNPRAERISGRMRLFRDTSSASSSSSSSSASSSALPEGRNEMACVLAVPATLSISDFCQFIAALVNEVVEMRVVVAADARQDGTSTDAREEGEEANAQTKASRESSSSAPSAAAAAAASYAVVLRFASQDAADAFYVNYDNRKFSSLVDGTCRVLFVKTIELVQTNAKARAPSDSTELPSCPVCLDRLDQDVSGVVTTVCSHAFHATCLSHWRDASCPVCRYTANPAEAPTCQHPGCGSTENLWACLVCGYVGCGRYGNAHAVDHWKKTEHCYSLELGTQRVWDYVRDGFVHRLIQSKTGLVELSPGGRGGGRARGARGSVVAGGGAGVAPGGEGEIVPGSPARRRGDFSRDDDDDGDDFDASASASCRPHRPRPSSLLDDGLDEYDADYPLDEGLEEALVSSKLDAIHSEYNQLLTSQLDGQRRYFEDIIAAEKAEKDGLHDAAAKATAQASIIAGAVKDARDAREKTKELNQKIDAHLGTISALRKECGVLQSLNETLLANHGELKTRLTDAEDAAKARERVDAEKIRDLEEQVRDLMVFLDARGKISANEITATGGAGAGGDTIEGGSVLGVGDAPPPPSRDASHARLQSKLASRRKR